MTFDPTLVYADRRIVPMGVPLWPLEGRARVDNERRSMTEEMKALIPQGLRHRLTWLEFDSSTPQRESITIAWRYLPELPMVEPV